MNWLGVAIVSHLTVTAYLVSPRLLIIAFVLLTLNGLTEYFDRRRPTRAAGFK